MKHPSHLGQKLQLHLLPDYRINRRPNEAEVLDNLICFSYAEIAIERIQAKKKISKLFGPEKPKRCCCTFVFIWLILSKATKLVENLNIILANFAIA